MKTYFDEATDKKLLEATTEEEVKAIIAGTVEGEKLADKIDLVMTEISRIKGSLDEEVDLDELDNTAGGSKLEKIYLSETTSCKATFYLQDQQVDFPLYCWSNDFCMASNEYDYVHTRYSNCRSGGRHDWAEEGEHWTCRKCGLDVLKLMVNFM